MYNKFVNFYNIYFKNYTNNHYFIDGQYKSFYFTLTLVKLRLMCFHQINSKLL